jgi:peptidoglycan L-alanyl-D-glutamate endopeptidase CwlK
MIDARSEKNLTGVHPDLQRIIRAALDAHHCHFIVTEGLRTLERQRKLVASGASKTLRSRHLTGHAVDVVASLDMDGDGKEEIRWDYPLFADFAKTVKAQAKLLLLTVEWGGDWKSFKDGPHFQLPHKEYPA